jgi:beta-phosphoglucomutase-like phosphatase (HAD superfamily)
MDGVLIDAKDWHFDSLNRALQLFGMEISSADHHTTFDGLPTNTKLQMLSESGNLPVKLHGFINQMKQKYTLELVYAKCTPKFVHEYALSKLKSEGYLLGVASNSIKNTVSIMMEKSSLDQYLDFQLSAEDVNRPKPFPDIYSAAAKRLGLLPSEILVVEDNQNGFEAAEAAGMHLLKVVTVTDVNYQNIKSRITEINELEGI